MLHLAAIKAYGKGRQPAARQSALLRTGGNPETLGGCQSHHRVRELSDTFSKHSLDGIYRLRNISPLMEATDLYKCLVDPQRLRILNLLEVGPLCVCHLQELLDESQVKISKQLAYLKQNGLVEARREATWMIYRLADEHPLLLANLAHLRSAECAECNQLQCDLAARGRLIRRITGAEADCPENVCRHLECV